jgi:hypothetical protein
MQESSSQVLTFPDNEEHIMARLIRYLYTSKYITDNISTSKQIAFHGVSDLEDPLNTQYGSFNETSDILMLHAKIYAIADKFNLAAMKEESRGHFLHRLSAWKTMGMNSIPDHGEGWLLLRALIQLVYQTTSSADYGLRDFMIVFAHSVAERTHRETIAQNSDFALNLVSRRLETSAWRCVRYQASSRVFKAVCEHYWRDYAVAECKDRIETQTWCVECGAFGTMRPTELDVKLCLT